MANEHRVMLVSLTWCNCQFICSVLSLWTSSMHACIFITVGTQFREQKVRTKVNKKPLVSNHPSLCLLELLCMHTCFRLCVFICYHVSKGVDSFYSQYSQQSRQGIGNSLPAGALSITLLPPPFFLGSTTWLVGDEASPPLPLQLPLIHSFCKQNPSLPDTCLTEAKNRDEIEGHGSIPSLSISAVIHQPVVVVVDVSVVWVDTGAPVYWKWGHWIIAERKGVELFWTFWHRQIIIISNHNYRININISL